MERRAGAKILALLGLSLINSSPVTGSKSNPPAYHGRGTTHFETDYGPTSCCHRGVGLAWDSVKSISGVKVTKA